MKKNSRERLLKALIKLWHQTFLVSLLTRPVLQKFGINAGKINITCFKHGFAMILLLMKVCYWNQINSEVFFIKFAVAVFHFSFHFDIYLILHISVSYFFKEKWNYLLMQFTRILMVVNFLISFIPVVKYLIN